MGSGLHPYDLIHLTLISSLKPLTPNIVALKVSTSSYEFGEDTIQSTTGEIEDCFCNMF